MRVGTEERFWNGGPRLWRAVRRRLQERNDAGMSLIELIVAVIVIGIVMLSGSIGIDYALSSSNAQRIRVEATSLAVTNMERDEQLAGTLGIGTTTKTMVINSTTFSVATTVSVLDQNGSQLTTVCTTSGASDSQQIFQVSVNVTWPHMNGTPPILQSTEVAPGQANALDLSNGEIAVPVVGVTSQPLTTPLNFTVTPQYIGTGSAPAYPTPTGETNPSGTVFNTGTQGCGVVTGLSTSPQWNYVVTLVSNSNWVSSNELSDSNVNGSATEDPTQTLSALAGQVSRVNPAFQMAQGVSTTFTFQPVTYACAGGNPAPSCYSATGPAPASPMPLTVANSSLTNGQYTFDTPSSTELLYPYSSYDLWSGDMAQSNPGATNVGLGTPLYPGTTSETPGPVVLTLTGSSTATAKIPTYGLSIQITSACAGASLVATEQSGQDIAYTLNPPAGGISASGMPLGQFHLSISGSACSLTSAKGLYLWITPQGIYQSAATQTNPYAGTLVSGNVAVTE